ncbi:DUF726-domain-containing protein [Auriscalpium vulgare]|uniref:DUF726-domain-containing protein n=1 Tax=Auriscalpium vulgare TaxID=40419 RepID=A0ACB8RLR1_9AGAM|nr:DUF726-domain-containing protein [Auriscalpium vulgare]
MSDANLIHLVPPAELSDADNLTIFQHIFRRLAAHRNTVELYAEAEAAYSDPQDTAHVDLKEDFVREVDVWSQSLLSATWVACKEPGGGECPTLDPLSDSSVADLAPLPAAPLLDQMLNAILFLSITSSKQYSARTRAFLSRLGTLDERAIAATLKNPDAALHAAEQHVSVDAAKAEHAARGATLRRVGMGVGALAGGLLIGVTGGLAAPLVGAGVGAVFGALGLGGSVVGLLAGGLAGSSVVCAALFGAYGARSTAQMVERYTQEVRDLAVLPVGPQRETLAVRLCVSGWLRSREDITAPWTVFGGDSVDTYALQWEVEVLEKLSAALTTLMKAQAMKYVRAQIIKRTFLASLNASLAPLAWLQIGRVVDNPWANAQARARKTGAVLADLLAARAFGQRPVSLAGYSLGAAVIWAALEDLATRPPAQTAHLVEDVFLLGAPVPADPRAWAAARRVVCGRLVNAYGRDDYVLAVLARASTTRWEVAGLQAVDAMGVENVASADVDGHLQWRAMVGRTLVACGAPGVDVGEAERQARETAQAEVQAMSGEDADRIIEEGPEGGSADKLLQGAQVDKKPPG